jgi:hypothetical protein
MSCRRRLDDLACIHHPDVVAVFGDGTESWVMITTVR